MKLNVAKAAVRCVPMALVAVSLVGCAGPVDPTAKAAFLKAVGATSITVFPAYVRQGGATSHDTAAAKRVAAFLAGERLATVSVSAETIPIAGRWYRNQARMFRQSAVAFADYLAEHPVDTDYALLAECLGGRSRIGGVHAYIVDAENRLAYAVLQNSHWRIFQTVDPNTPDDCTEIVIRALRDRLAPRPPDK